MVVIYFYFQISRIILIMKKLKKKKNW